MKDLNGKVGIITGASSGIGRRLAVDLAAAGVKLALAARSVEGLEETARLAAMNSPPAGPVILPCDVSERSAVESMIAKVRKELGPVDILVNNAGQSRYHTFVETPVEEFEYLMRVNYLGAVYCLKAVLPGMLERGDGHIVNVSSIAGRIGTLRHTAYSATKFALTGLSESLYYELLGTGVGRTIVNPGRFETHLCDHESFRDFPGRQSTMMKPPEVLTRAIVEAIRANKIEITVPRSLWAGVAIKDLCPPLFRRLHSRFLRKSRVRADVGSRSAH